MSLFNLSFLKQANTAHLQKSQYFNTVAHSQTHTHSQTTLL